jgi:branched-chain amino acid transport system ATP-binding protein
MTLELKNISFSFTGKKDLLHDISFKLDKGTIYALLGTNGSGKTTLLNIISGFLNPRSGKILFKGSDITHMQPFKRDICGIGRTFQDLRIVNKLSVKDNILLAMRNNPTDKWYNSILPGSFFSKEIDKLNGVADKLINDYFLSDIRDSLAGEISFGQQKLLTLACCAANESDLLLLDEPIAGINQEYMKIIAALFLLLKEKGKTIFFIEHNTDFISGAADSVYFLDQGRIRQYANINEMSSDEYVKEAYL